MNLNSSKILSRESLKEQLILLKNDARKIVFTNGCFDILHAGHVDYLTRAKLHGDVLVIGVNSDSSVRLLNKGDNRPVNPEQARAFVLSGLSSVDFVTIFDEQTPVELIKFLQPDCHVKGGDYKKEELPEYAVIKAYGGDVIIEGFVPGFSTTSILEKLK
jgi:glycerol-3-phosphate cytidylyltransferase